MINPMDDLEGKFVIKDEGKLLEFDRCGDLPDEFDHLIEFNPSPLPEPHSVNDHITMSKYSEYLPVSYTHLTLPTIYSV